MKISELMLNCNGCEYLHATDGDYYLACNDGHHWPEGVPESPPCFKFTVFRADAYWVSDVLRAGT